MSDERNLLRHGLPVEDDGWAQFEARFLGRGADCPPAGALIALAQNSADDPGRLEAHLRTCPGCRSWLEAFRRGLQPPAPEAPTPLPAGLRAAGKDSGGSRPGPARSPAPPGGAAEAGYPGLDSVVLTGIVTLLVSGRTEEALRVLRPFLADILEAVGLDRGLSEQLWQFLQDRLCRSPVADAPGHPEGPPKPLLAPQWLREFARDRLQFEDLPVAPETADWEPVLSRCALQRILSSAQPPAVHEFLRAALERGVDSALGLEEFRLSEEHYRSRISDMESRRLIRRVRQEHDQFARLVGLN
jgi:hypothetical protein